MNWDFDRSSEIKLGLPKGLIFTFGFIIAAAALAPQTALSSDSMSRAQSAASNDPAAGQAVMSKEMVTLPAPVGSNPAGQSLDAELINRASGPAGDLSGPTDQNLNTTHDQGLLGPAGAEDGKLAMQSSGSGMRDPAGSSAAAQSMLGDGGKSEPATGLGLGVPAGQMSDPAGNLK